MLREWGSCGRVVLVDDVPVGYAVYAPDAFVPGAAAFPTAPVSAGRRAARRPSTSSRRTAAAGWPGCSCRAWPRDLVQRGGIGAIEAFGDPPGRGGRCLLPVEFLGSVGFKTHRPHPTAPRMRMDLRAAVSWKDEVESAFGRLVGAMRPKSARGPAPKATRASRDTR